MATDVKTTQIGLEIMEAVRQLSGPELPLSAERRARFLRSVGCVDRGGEVFFRGARLVIPSTARAPIDPRADGNPHHPVCFMP